VKNAKSQTITFVRAPENVLSEASSLSHLIDDEIIFQSPFAHPTKIMRKDIEINYMMKCFATKMSKIENQ
jgi:hypothetical protein